LYSMGIFANEIFLLDFPFKGRKSLFEILAVSYKFQQCHWHHRNHFSSVIHTAAIVSAVSFTPRKSFQRCHWHSWNITHNCQTFKRCNWHRRNRFSGDPAEIVSAVIPLKSFQWCHWHMQNGFRGLGGFDWWKKPEVENLVKVSL
jgi:hypothetical protein